MHIIGNFIFEKNPEETEHITYSGWVWAVRLRTLKTPLENFKSGDIYHECVKNHKKGTFFLGRMCPNCGALCPALLYRYALTLRMK